IRGRSLAAKQIDSELFPNCRRAPLQGGEWHAHGSVPNLRCRVDASRYDKTRVPGPAKFVMRLRQVDIQIDPLPLRRHFELPVSPDVLEVGTNKQFGYVP